MAQSATELESDKMNRVAKRLQCNCGCNMDMTCRMEPYMCGTCKKFKTQIYALQQAGKSDDEVMAQLVSENGKGIVATHPGSIGSILSYTGLGVGLLLIFWFYRRYRRPAPVGENVDAAVLERYHDQIEKETSKLD
jgi:cytochrome c-type biogenesis protein CcmH/NrfF